MARKATINIVQVKELFESGLSTYKVAEQLGCSQSYICKFMKNYNKKNPTNPIHVRDKSEAQKAFIEKNGHQRIGTTHSDESKAAISTKMGDFFESDKGTEVKKRIAEGRKEAWEGMSKAEQAENLTKMRTANRESMKIGEGSKFENYVAEELRKVGYILEQRTQNYTPGQLEVDIAIPDLKIAVEVDGPTHFTELYGPERLKRAKANDELKNGQLTTGGWDLLRIQDKSASLSPVRIKRITETLSKMIEDRKSRKGTVGQVIVIQP